MSIVSSTYAIEGVTQANNRVNIIESHLDSTGMTHIVHYRATSGSNYQAIADARAIVLADQLAEKEANEVING